jgi:hypothetical protein
MGSINNGESESKKTVKLVRFILSSKLGRRLTNPAIITSNDE